MSHPDTSKIVTWTLVPPHSCRFQNDVGSSCTIYFERGREQEVAKVIQNQIAYQLMWSLGLAPGQAPVAPRAQQDPMPLAVDTATGQIRKRGVTVHDNDNPECPWNSPETNVNPVLSGIACTCAKKGEP